jgi:hypothetical protein
MCVCVSARARARVCVLEPNTQTFPFLSSLQNSWYRATGKAQGIQTQVDNNL